MECEEEGVQEMSVKRIEAFVNGYVLDILTGPEELRERRSPRSARQKHLESTWPFPSIAWCCLQTPTGHFTRKLSSR